MTQRTQTRASISRNSTLPEVAVELIRQKQGNLNVTVDLTLRTSQTTTTLTDNRIGPNSFLGWMPQTAHAATAAPNLWISNRVKGSCTVNHASSANSDQTFTFVILGG